MKKIVALLLFFSLLFPSFFSIATSAAVIEGAGGGVDTIPLEEIKGQNEEKTVHELPVKSCEAALKDEETKGKVKEFRDKDANHLEQYTLDLVELVMNAFNINTLEQLLFGNPYCIWFDGWGEEEMIYGLFPESIFEEIIKPAFTLFVSFLAVVACLAIMINGLKLMGRGFGSRINIGEEFLILIGVLFGIGCYWIFVGLLLEGNYALVLSLKGVIENQGIELSSFSIVAGVDDFQFSDILILFSEWIILLFLNVLYMARLALITLLTFIGGLVLVLCLFKRTRGILGKWLKDYIGAIYMQSVHSLYFSMVILYVAINDLSFVFKFTLLLLFLPLSSMLLNMTGFSSAANVATGSANKFASSAAAAIQLSKMAGGGASKKLGGLKSSPNSLTTGATKISALASGSNNPGWQALTTGANMAGTIGGSMAGLVIGPSGSVIGGQLGGAMASGALQVPRNVTAGVKGVLDTRSKVKNNELSKDNISDKRQIFGSYGESIGVIFGKGEAGRRIGESFSGISKQQLMNSTELGGLGGVSLSDIASKYPECKVIFEQTNMGSGFYLQKEDMKSLISPIGMADNSLPDGMTRTIEYSALPSASTNNLANSDGSEVANHFTMNADQMGLYSMTEAPMLRDDTTGSKVLDHAFDSSMYKPEQHVNMGDFNTSIANLSSSKPYEGGPA